MLIHTQASYANPGRQLDRLVQPQVTLKSGGYIIKSVN